MIGVLTAYLLCIWSHFSVPPCSRQEESLCVTVQKIYIHNGLPVFYLWFPLLPNSYSIRKIALLQNLCFQVSVCHLSAFRQSCCLTLLC